MGQYGKLWAALLGAAAVGLNESGVIDTGQANAVVSSGLALLTAFGVYQIPNSQKQ